MLIFAACSSDPEGAAIAAERAEEIEVCSSRDRKIDHATQLFDTLDPFPFHERDLDEEAAEFIVGWTRELPKTGPSRIVGI